MSVNVQHVGFTAKAMAREYSFLVRESWLIPNLPSTAKDVLLALSRVEETEGGTSGNVICKAFSRS
jgi:hypothetical protein